jgi:PAS domain S-box-containing protein
MKFPSSLTARYIALSLIILAFIAGLTGSTFLLTAHMEGEARKINLTGRQRMHVLHIAPYMHAVPSFDALPDAGERTQLGEDVRRAAAAFEEVLFALRDGSDSLGLRPVHGNDRQSMELLTALIGHWENTQKPLLMELLSNAEFPAGMQQQSCVACHAAFQDHLQEIDDLVFSLENHYVQELNLFKQARILALVALVFIAWGMWLFVRKRMIRPIQELEQAAGKIRAGEFEVRLPVAGDDEIGALTRTFGSMADTMGALFRRLAMLAQALDSSPDLVLITDPAGMIMHANPRVDSILGCRAAEIVGRRISAVLSPAGSPDAADLLVEQTLAGGWEGGLPAVRKDGSRFPALFTTAPMRDERSGEIAALIVIVRDISERIRGEQRKEQEDARLRDSLQLDRMPGKDEQAILDFILEEEIGLTGSQYGFLGWVDEEEATLKVCAWSGEVLQACATEQKSVEFPVSGGGIWTEPLRRRAPVLINGYDHNRDKKGTPPGHVEIRRFLGVPVFDGERIVMLAGVANKEEEYNMGDALTMAALLADAWRVIQRNRAQAEVRQQNEALEQTVAERTAELEQARQLAEAASRAKSEFLANMSHELRTPLNAVMGFAEIIRDGMAGPTTAAQREYLGDIMESGDHLLSLINDILDLAKVEAGRQELELAAFPVADLVAHSLALFREKAMKHAIVLASEGAEQVGTITADGRALKQVLVNLLANALKFTPDGGRVLVSVGRENGDVRFSVTDTGIGIAEEDIPRLFQPFQQLESSLTRKYPGTGLGLSLCRKLVEMHRGRIWAESSPATGSCFSFVVPAQPSCSLPAADADGPRGGSASAAGIMRWPAGRQHLKRLFSLQQRQGLEFALLRFRFPGPSGSGAMESAAALLQQQIRTHDLAMTDEENQTITLALVGAERDVLTGIAARIGRSLQNQGEVFQAAQVFSSQDGKSFEELLLALNRQEEMAKNDPAGEEIGG